MCISEPRGFLTQTSLALIASLAWRCPTRDHWSESPHHIHFYADWSSKASVVSGRAPGWPMRSTKVRETFGFLGFIRDIWTVPQSFVHLWSTKVWETFGVHNPQGFVLWRSDPSRLVRDGARSQADRSQGSCQVDQRILNMRTSQKCQTSENTTKILNIRTSPKS